MLVGGNKNDFTKAKKCVIIFILLIINIIFMNMKHLSKITFAASLALSLLIAGPVVGYAVDINGTNADETLTGTAEADKIVGGQGNDVLNGLEAADKVYGGQGNDYANGGAGSDEVYGDNGSDTLFGSGGSDNVFGGDGNDYVIGDDQSGVDSGADVLIGNQGQDVIFGQGGEDMMYGGQGYDFMIGGESADKIYGDRDGVVVWGEAGDDQIYVVPTTGKSGTFNVGHQETQVSIGDIGYSAVISGPGYDTITVESREVLASSRLHIFNSGNEEDTVYFAPEYTVAANGADCNKPNNSNVITYDTCASVSFTGQDRVKYTRLFLNAPSGQNITVWLCGNIKYATGDALNSGTLTYSNDQNNIEVPTMVGGGNGIAVPQPINIPATS
jgi:hypothetical protein